MSDGSLIGQWFHSFSADPAPDGQRVRTINGRALCWQGQILGEPSIGTFLIELYSWWDGTTNGRSLVSLKEMTDWVFYPSHYAMCAAAGCLESRGDWICKGYADWICDMGHQMCGRCSRFYSGARPLTAEELSGVEAVKPEPKRQTAAAVRKEVVRDLAEDIRATRP